MKALRTCVLALCMLSLTLMGCVSTPTTRNIDDQFLQACAQGNLEEAKALLAKGANLNAKDSFEYNGLYKAVSSNKQEMVKFLLEQGMDANTPVRFKSVAAVAAIMNENLEILQILLDHGASLVPEDTQSLLFTAIHNKKPLSIDYLLKVDTRDLAEDRLILIGAAIVKRWDLIPTLIDRGAPVQAVEGKGRGILRYASEDLETVKLLIAKGANVNNIPNDGVPPASSAILGKHLEAAKFMLENGADINPVYTPPKEDSRTPLPPLFAACFQLDDQAFLEYLINKGANLNYVGVDDSGAKITALQLLLANKKEDLALFLLDKGADSDLIDQRAALKEIAAKNKLSRVLERL